MPFYNCHIHIFSASCSPKRFLKVGLPSWLDWAAGGLKSIVETRFGRATTRLLARTPLPISRTLTRYASFSSIGTKSSQKDVFENILQFYPPGTRFVVLTLNMDEMGAGPSELKYRGQIEKVIELRRLYPDTLLPFLSIDPRMGSKEEVTRFVHDYIGTVSTADGTVGFKPFIGVKLYPSMGFFPYDARLEGLYQFCEANNVPIMTHCTPSGAYFLGKLSLDMVAPLPIACEGEPAPPVPRFSGKDNDKDSDMFLLPSNWNIVLKKYPRLKICFAHMGGVSEMWPKNPDRPIASWYNEVKRLMDEYPNIYTDISYTLSDEGTDYRTWKEIESLLEHPRFKSRILFGTDYFMTEQQDSEKNLAQKFINWLLNRNKAGHVKLLTDQNPISYLTSSFYQA